MKNTRIVTTLVERALFTMMLQILLFVPHGSIQATEPETVSVAKIWDRGQHNAFTDLIRFRSNWWCTFREGKGHAGDDGKVRVIVSVDGTRWKSAALIEDDGIDLRDPKLSLMPDGKLMLIMGGSIHDNEGTYLTRAPRVTFSQHGDKWTVPQKLMAEDH